VLWLLAGHGADDGKGEGRAEGDDRSTDVEQQQQDDGQVGIEEHAWLIQRRVAIVLAIVWAIERYGSVVSDRR